jgi:soluble lytic murein transglycosylase
MLGTAGSVKARYSDLATKYATINHIDPDSVMAIICQESGGHSNAVNPEKGGFGALGLMQLRSGALGDWNHDHPSDQITPDQLMDPEINIKVGSYYLGQRYNRWDKDTTKAFASYYGGDTGWPTNTKALPYAEHAKIFLDLLKKI